MSTLDDTPPQDTVSGFYGWTDTLKGIYYVFLRNVTAHGATFYGIGEHTPIAGIREGIRIFKENGCDVIVSVGGGSPIDGSKAILYSIQLETGGATLKQIAIPTTLSAAEYSIGAGFTTDEGEKIAVSSQDLAPAGIILDGELTLPTPERLWLSTGIRSLDHAVENLYRPGVSFPVKQLMYAALKDLFHYLPASKKDPTNVEYRQRLQLASWMSLWPMKLQKYSALGISHSLGHKLGARFSIPHGITSCLTLAPTVVMKADVGSEDDKKEPSTGSLEGDDLGLDTTLSAYKGALGTQNQNYEVERVVKLLESIL
ncbi:alcohol dehydrogenase IV [Ephemerocybe angulata]|uniref:Alcohol dehydrogenase IV n=1 Tax=Ephemerocybe angulata TaxID=980116 RepID=A0A8H6ICF0_9AGAR|nr:alcohol dehydrogenase IV [Tulosesus angulatus]